MTRASELRQDYENLLRKASTLFPKVDQKLLLNILQYQTAYSDWDGRVLLKVIYPAGTEMERKKSGYTKSSSAWVLLKRTGLSGSRPSTFMSKTLI